MVRGPCGVGPGSMGCVFESVPKKGGWGWVGEAGFFGGGAWACCGEGPPATRPNPRRCLPSICFKINPQGSLWRECGG